MVDRTRVVVGLAVVIAAGLCVGVGSATASTGSDLLYSHELTDETAVDQHLDSGGFYWQGQSLWLEDSNDEVDSEQLLLREYDLSENNVGSVVRTIEFDDNEAIVESGELTGTYVLVPTDSRDRVIVIDDGIVAGSVDVADATPFEFQEQSLYVQWEPGQAGTTPADRGINIESNRARYNINVSSPELSFAELEAIFMGDRSLRDDNEPFGDRRPFEQRHQMYDVHADDDVIVLRGFRDGSLSADFGAVESFPEVFTIEVTDTGVARSTALPSDGGAGPFSFTALSVDEQVDPGESVEMAVTIENNWPTTETGDVVFELGQATSTVETELGPGEETTVSSSLTAPSTAGETDYRISTAGDEISGTVTVGDPTANVEDESGDNGDGDDDSGILGTVIGLVFPQALIGLVMTLLSAAAFVVWHRR